MLDAQAQVPTGMMQRPSAPAGGGGALKAAAQAVARAGVGGDTMAVHVNPQEFQQMQKIFGQPSVNPNTGLPQFSFLGDWGGALAGGAGALLGVGGTIGDALGSATGLWDAGGTASNAIGSALLGGGVGALTGGGKGALYGALAGGATPYITSGLGFGGANGALTNLLGGGASAATSVNGEGDVAAAKALQSAGTSAGSGAASSGGGIFAKGGALPYLIGGLMLANTVGQMSNSGKTSQAQKDAAAANAASMAKFNAPLPIANFSRTQQVLPLSAYLHYGQNPAQSFFTGNQLGTTSNGYARGGPVAGKPTGALQGAAGQGAVHGPGDGRADVIPAALSNNEYVLDAESMALLGNGSPDAGAAKMDQMRANLRKHKGGALAQGRISPDAKAPEHYMRGGRA